MNTFSLAAASLAAIMAIAMFDAKPAEARRGMSFSAPRAAFSGRSVMRSSSRSFARASNRTFVRKTFVNKSFTNKSFVNKSIVRASNRPLVRSATKSTLALQRAVQHKPKFKQVANVGKATLKKGAAFRVVQNSTLKSGKLSFAKLPLHKAVAGNAGMIGRLSVPKNLKPKLKLASAPLADHKHRLAPFVQRNWKKAFFWVAIAGVGYVTIPELYYDRFYRCAGVAEPDYEECIRVLSFAAIEEEEASRVRYPMPSTAVYRYSATTAPKPEASQACSLEPFVERKWNREFVWVQIPQTGNVTVPEEIYDQFSTKVGGEPPDYPAACKVLVEAAAADTVVATTAPDLERRL